mmetsp:Transcript_48483/g.55770  ORF Transcript_48483/g.55770 Transcript_48483/m.55770 type:complete len:224 (+) Transcript_48483:36-707(+)
MKKTALIKRFFGCSGKVAPSIGAFNPADRINMFWFEDSLRSTVYEKKAEAFMQRWFIQNDDFDEACKEFEPFYQWAARGELSSWNNSRHGYLAHILLLDQFPRNLFRNDPRSFETDPMALALTREAIETGYERKLHSLERAFVCMPYQHTEDLEAQREGIEAFRRIWMDSRDPYKETAKGNYDYAIVHKDIVKRFGRFPHRNEVLGRQSTPEELEFLKSGRGF